MKSLKLLICFLVLSFVFVQPYFLYAQDISHGTIKSHKEENSGWFSNFDSTDWLLLSGVAFADLADFASSNYMSYVSRKEAQLCSPNVYLCSTPYSSGIPNGEGNPLITGLYGTKYPNTLQYASWFAGYFAIQSLVAWALPERWRNVSFGLFIGVGMADMVGNGYGAGFGWRF